MFVVSVQVDFEELAAFWLADEGVEGGVSPEVQEAVDAIMQAARQEKLEATQRVLEEQAAQAAGGSVDTLTAVEL